MQTGNFLFLIFDFFFFFGKNFRKKKERKKNGSARVAIISATCWTRNKLFFKGGLSVRRTEIAAASHVNQTYISFMYSYHMYFHSNIPCVFPNFPHAVFRVIDCLMSVIRLRLIFLPSVLGLIYWIRIKFPSLSLPPSFNSSPHLLLATNIFTGFDKYNDYK